jgi:hypothetical protein
VNVERGDRIDKKEDSKEKREHRGQRWKKRGR